MAMIDPLYLYAPPIGFLVGVIVAATGVGGGILLLPLQMVGLHIHPIIAVGSDVIFMFFTKLWATILNWKRETVDRQLALALLTGSIPGGLLGIGLLYFLRLRWGGHGVNSFLRATIGLLLVVIPIFMLMMDRIKARVVASSPPEISSPKSRRRKASLIGFLGGFLVGLTSVGSGSVIILLLFLFYRRSTSVLIGTDILHGMVLSGMLGLIHLQMSTVNLRLVMLLMSGAVVGVPLGSKLATLIPSIWLRRTVLALLIPMGLKLL
jgi:uncharacterized membrane protein YfcA